MCLAVPGRIIEITVQTPMLRMAKVSFAGAVKEICIEWLPEANVGDYVLAHAGTALSMVDTTEAEATLKIFNQWVDAIDNEKPKNLSV